MYSTSYLLTGSLLLVSTPLKTSPRTDMTSCSPLAAHQLRSGDTNLPFPPCPLPAIPPESLPANTRSEVSKLRSMMLDIKTDGGCDEDHKKSLCMYQTIWLASLTMVCGRSQAQAFSGLPTGKQSNAPILFALCPPPHIRGSVAYPSGYQR